MTKTIVRPQIIVATCLVTVFLLAAGRQLGVPVDVDTGASPLGATGLTGTWVRTGGPLGGLGYDIRVRPDNPDIMYVTDAYAGVHKSTNGGVTWTASDTGIDARTGPSNDAIPVFCLTIDPNTYNTIWIGMTGVRGVYRSTDAGATWVRKDTGIIENVGLTIRGIGVKPGDSNTVFAAGEVASVVWNGGTEARGREFDLVQGVIYRSTNAGQTWSEVWRGDNMARYVLFDPTNPTTIYASTGLFDREAKNSNPTTGAPGGVGVLKSTDGGTTWTVVSSGLGNLYINSLAISPANSQVLLAGAANNTYQAGGGIYRTTNGGASWQLVGGTQIQSVEFSTGTDTTAYAAGSSQFYSSADSGATWTRLDTDGSWGPPAIRPGFPIDLQVDPRNARRVFVNNYGGGNFLSTDGAVSWTSASTGYTGADISDVAVDPTNAARLYVTGRSGPFNSGNGGATWSGMNPLTVQEIAEGARVAVDPSNANNVLMSSAHWGWTYRSTNRGTTWTLVTNYFAELRDLPVSDTNQKFQGMQAMAFAPSDPTKVYGGFGVWRCATMAESSLCDRATIASIFTSADGGATWTRHAGVLGNRTVSRIVVDPQNASKAWAATLGGGVFITTDGGNTWTASNSGLTSLNVWSLAGTAGTGNVLYAGTVASGVFKSTNGGATWSAASAGMSATEPIAALVVSPVDANVVYAGSRSSGVYLSTNAGASWSLDSAGLRQRAVQALSVSANGDVLYAATQGEGVYRLGTPPQSPIPEPPTSLSSSTTGSSVTLTWSAPAFSATPTSYVIEAGSTSTASDLAQVDTGSSATTFMATGVASGSYFVRVRSRAAGGTSSASNEIVLTVGGSGCLSAPGAPGGLAASVSGTTVALTWQGPSGACAPTGYVIEAGSAAGQRNLAVVPTGSTGTSFSASGVGGGTYFVRVRASNASGTSAASNEIRLVVGAGDTVPSRVTATASGSGVVLTWSEPSGRTPERYAISGGTAPDASTLPVIVTPDASNSYTIPALPPGSYYFSVSAIFADGVSPRSDEAAVAVSSSPAVAGPPSGALATSEGHDLTVAWTPAPGHAAVYYVEIGSAPGRADVATLTKTEPSVTYRADAATYYMRVRAASGGAVSAPSNEVSVPVAPAACAGAPLAPVLLPVSTTHGETTVSWLPADGPPADGYRVDATGPTGATTITSRGAGTSLTAGLAPGMYRIRVTALSPCGVSAASQQIAFTQPDPATGR